MKYLLLICAEGPVSGEVSPADGALAGAGETPPYASAHTGGEPGEAGDMTERHGILVPGAQPAMEATLRFHGGNVVIADGPYASVQGQIQGFDVVEVEQLEEVIELASQVPQPARRRPGLPGSR